MSFHLLRKERIILKVIRQRLILLLVLSIIVLLICLILFARSINIIADVQFVFAVLLLLFIILAGLFLIEYDRYNIARLILENQIMNVQIAGIGQSMQEVELGTLKIDVVEYTISCFGILLGPKVIKFNIDGIKLKEIEIDDDSISIVYGKDNENKTIKLLHGTIEKQELHRIVEKFRYETGITPNIID